MSERKNPTRYHLSLSERKRGRERGAFKRGRPTARITAAQVEHVINALQPTKTNYPFETRMKKYARDAAADMALYAWLEARGWLPEPGELPNENHVREYNRERLSAARIAKRAAMEARS